MEDTSGESHHEFQEITVKQDVLIAEVNGDPKTVDTGEVNGLPDRESTGKQIDEINELNGENESDSANYTDDKVETLVQDLLVDNEVSEKDGDERKEGGEQVLTQEILGDTENARTDDGEGDGTHIGLEEVAETDDGEEDGTHGGLEKVAGTDDREGDGTYKGLEEVYTNDTLTDKEDAGTGGRQGDGTETQGEDMFTQETGNDDDMLDLLENDPEESLKNDFNITVSKEQGTDVTDGNEHGDSGGNNEGQEQDGNQSVLAVVDKDDDILDLNDDSEVAVVNNDAENSALKDQETTSDENQTTEELHVEQVAQTEEMEMREENFDQEEGMEIAEENSIINIESAAMVDNTMETGSEVVGSEDNEMVEEMEKSEDMNKDDEMAALSSSYIEEDAEKDEVDEDVEKVVEADVSMEHNAEMEENQSQIIESDGDQAEPIVIAEELPTGDDETSAQDNIVEKSADDETSEQDNVVKKSADDGTATKEGKIRTDDVEENTEDSMTTGQELGEKTDEVTKDESEDEKGINTESEQIINKDENVEEQKTENNETDHTQKSETKDDDDDDVQIIDLDDSDTEKEADVKQEKVDAAETKKESGGLEIQIASVSGANDLTADDKKFQDSLNKPKEEAVSKIPATKPVVPVKQEVKQEVKPDNKSPKSKVQTCIVCKKTGKCKYNIVRNGDIKHLCDDECFKRFRSNPTAFLRATTPPESIESKTVKPVNNQHGQYKTCQVCQIMNINASSSKPFLNWQGMDFCGEDCLGKFQSSLNAACSVCTSVIQQAIKGKFCIKFGTQIRQFCSQGCYNEFMKHQKMCECCQKDISKSPDAFVAAAGADGSFKDFCSQICLQKYEEKNNRDLEITGVEQKKTGAAPKGTHTCSVCSKVSTMKHQVQLEGKANYLCSDPCFSAFQYANKLTMNTCDNCGVYCYNEGMNPQYIQFEGQQKRFCSFMCVNTFKTLNKKIVSCSWCNCKKSNFDMIERVDANNKYQLFCSLNCLSLYRVNLQATSNQAVLCDQCKRYVPAQYHLTMSDASVRNFCSYSCVMSFQSQFTGAAPAQNPAGTAPKAGIQTRSTNRPTAPLQQRAVQPAVKSAPQQQNVPRPPAIQSRPTNPNMNSIPIISNVVSLAPQGNQQQQVNFKSNQQVPLVINNKNSNIRLQPPAPTNQMVNQIQQTVIIQPPQPKSVKNKTCLCKPFVQTKATSCRPHTQTKETQTDKDKEPHGAIIPIPIPFYVPVPMAMYTQLTPTPFPFPVPIPIPCFIPTTKKSTASILKHIKEIREKIPDDPLEAELLMMAEAVSAVAKDSSDSESEKSDAEMEPNEDIAVNSPYRSDSPEPEVPAKPAELGEDMLQMALRMATEMTSEPVMDLEETIEPVPLNSEPPAKSKPELLEDDDDNEDDEDYTPVRETRSKGKGVKRGGGGGNTRRRSKRQKTPIVIKLAESPASEEPDPVVEPPVDANMYLKYTYGVNAWKHWVVQKNNQLDKVSKQGSGKLKLFKTDMLQCSADELNYSLCLFVKEVRKPNGEEYLPDSIYYLCLGIQMFLFENERIDNIFTDIYYEKFTECLNEVLQRYTPKLNAAGQIVCRIEEEHLWECKQLGAHSPHVLLNTLVYFNTKYFQLKTAEDHLKLSFTHIMKHWKKTAPGKGNAQGRSVYLRYYCPAPLINRLAMDGSKRKKEELPVYEQAENLDNPLRCPVKLYEFYLSKCPESIKNRSDAFYLVPERSCVPDSPVWYSTQNLQIEAMNKMLHRTMLVREIQESFIHTQPIYT